MSLANKSGLALLSVSVSIVVAFIVTNFWHEWTVPVFGAIGLYIIGGIRFMPWKTPISKAISIGVFIGLVGPTVVWIFIKK